MLRPKSIHLAPVKVQLCQREGVSIECWSGDFRSGRLVAHVAKLNGVARVGDIEITNQLIVAVKVYSQTRVCNHLGEGDVNWRLTVESTLGIAFLPEVFRCLEK